MRNIFAAAFLTASLAAPHSALALDVICPPLVREGVTQLAAAFTGQTGIPVTVKAPVMGKILDEIKTGPVDVILLPSSVMETLAKDQALDARQTLGRMEIALAVRPGAPHPDISTLDKFAGTIKSAKTIAYTQPGPPRNSMEAGIIDRILQRPEFSGAHILKTANSSGVDALAKGDADMALQVTSAFISRKDVELVGPLPPALGAHIDVDIAVSKTAADAKAAADFVRTLTGPEATQAWRKFGLVR
jgi:molybdate transport system substrate-binding protein